MSKIPLCALGRSVKRRLDDLNETQNWLIKQVQEDTGLFFDGSYLYKIMTGRLATPSIVSSVCNILMIDHPTKQETKEVNL